MDFPGTDAITQIIEAIIEITSSAQDVLIERAGFSELASYLEKIVPLLKELSKRNITGSDSLDKAIEILKREIKLSKKLTDDCSKKNKFYLLMNCRTIVKLLQETTREISRALSLIPLISMDISVGVIEEIHDLCDNMDRAEFRAAKSEEMILEKIELGIQERNVDRSYANKLLVLVAEAVGISTDRSALKREFEEFKTEIENAQLRKDQAEAIQMDQIIALLERADAASTPKEKEIKYLTKRNSLGSQPLEPLQSFVCPITRDVMVDPVETSSGHTFERSAIEKWFADGHTLCPLTVTTLDTSVLRPNKTLRQSIEEWKDRNTIIMIGSSKQKLLSKEDEEVVRCLGMIQDLCEQREQHRDWIVLENYIPILIGILGSKNHEIRTQVLSILYILAKDCDDAKERIVKVHNAIESIVRSLGRRVGERKLAVTLLLELSENEIVRDSIGKAQGCILLLVTMSRSDDSQAARDAQNLLENLSFSDENVIQMARSNYFKHLLQRLSSGSDEVKMMMSLTLAEMELTDHNKSSLVEEGVLLPLLDLVSNGNIEFKKFAVKALQNLSSLPKNGLQMIREGAVPVLLQLLGSHSSPIQNSLEQVAATITNLAISTLSQETKDDQILMLESEDDIFGLFKFVNFSGAAVQQSILRTFYALCKSPSAENTKIKLTQCSAIQVLVQLCELENITVRADAVKLMCCLTEKGEAAIIIESMTQKCIETLLRITNTSDDTEEIASALGIISNLPEDSQLTRWLLEGGVLPIIFRFLSQNGHTGPTENHLIENAVGALCRFNTPRDIKSQTTAAEAGIINVLVHLLDSGTFLTKTRAATSLGKFSRNSLALSKRVPKTMGWFCFTPQPEHTCVVHQGVCSVETSFCLIEAEAVGPLVRVLEERDPSACEASLDALLTLIEGEGLQSGSKLLADAKAIPAIIKFLSSGSETLQEKALSALDMIFRVEELKQKYGMRAQMPLVDLAQRGSGRMKSMSARVLAHLNVLHNQSSFFESI